MKNLKTHMIVGAIFVSIVGTLFHFVYSWSGNNNIIALFSPINESIWEHAKLIFFPMLLFSIYTNRALKGKYPCIPSAMSLATLLSPFFIIILFYTYSGILGFNTMLLDISVFYISVILAFYIAYKTAVSCRAQKYTVLLDILIILMVILFFSFTFYQPDISLFVSPK